MTFLGAQCQSSHSSKPHTAITKVARQVFEQHQQYRQASITHRRFKHQDIVPLLENLRQHPLFDVQVAGQSVEGRDIYLVKAGTGKTKVLLWSQMHGDEPTATMALFDLFNFLGASDELDPIRKEILENTTLYFVPMLNPDGAEVFTRRNALKLDLNRDALQLQSPEARLLKSLRDSLQPEFGFNLHDQSRLYTVGTTPKPATISFLAPAYDHAQSVNEVRERAMRTIVGMNESIQQFIPGQVAKYSDEHEPRAFGDNIQKWGTSTILIESGGFKGDPEKQYIRQLNFASIIAALHLIAQKGYTHYSLEDYYKIPENQRNLYDLVVRQVRYHQNGQDTILDIGINRDETNFPNQKGFFHRSSVQEIGDMSTYYGYEEVNGEGLRLLAGKVYDKPFRSLAEVTPERALQLLKQGYTTVRLVSAPSRIDPVSLPLNMVGQGGRVSHELGLGRGANFILQDQNGQVRYVIVNGFVYDLQEPLPVLFHGLVL